MANFGPKPRTKRGRFSGERLPGSYDRASSIYHPLLKAVFDSGQTDQQIADRAGVGKNNLWRLRSGRHVNVAVLDALAHTLGVPVIIGPDQGLNMNSHDDEKTL